MTNSNRLQHSSDNSLHNHQDNGPDDEINPTENINDFDMVVINEHHNELRAAVAAAATNANDLGGGGGGSVGSMTTTVAADTDGDNSPQSAVHFRKMPRTVSQAELSHKLINGVRPLSVVRTSSYAPSIGGQSFRSGVSDHEHLIPPPSSDHEKSKHTRRYFATVFAISYAIFLVIFGTVVFVLNEVVVEETVYPVAESFALFMISVSFAYFIFLYIDIRMHVRKAKRTIKERERRQQLFAEQVAREADAAVPLGGDAFGQGLVVTDEMIWQRLRLAPLQPVSHKYCFMTGRHGEFFYLKFGATWFALGLLIHSILQIAYQIIFLTTRDQEYCASKVTLAMDILFPLYSLFVLFFIYKYMNVIINEYRGLARIMIMHALGTSLAMWIHTIVSETANAIEIARYIEEDTEVKHECVRPDVLNYVHRNISPYLYPFIIEFCILIVGIFYMMWANISHCPRKFSALGHHGDQQPQHQHQALDNGDDGRLEEGQQGRGGGTDSMNKASAMEERGQSVVSEDHCGTTTDQHDQLFRTNLVMYADCHASNRGLFAGMLLIVVTVVFIILFFVATSDPDYLDTGILVNNIFELTVLLIMLVAVIVAYFQTAKLDINHHPMSMLDDMLLFIAVPAFFLETIFSMVPAVRNLSWLNMAIIFAQLLQILVQTPFIIDGLRRCANAAHLRRTKPGRELITFLTIANVSLWLFYTLSVKTNYTGDERYTFYGKVLWNILNHISLPLIMFYRFHASVCLVDMWRHSYEPEPAGH